MKTSTIVRAFENSATPAARLAAWQTIPIQTRLAKYKNKVGTGSLERLTVWRDEQLRYTTGPEVCENNLWVLPDSKEIASLWAGREFLDHRGWYTDEDEHETMEAYAVRLVRFPGLLFEAIRLSESGDMQVDLSTATEIDYSYSWIGENAERDCAREVILSADSVAESKAECEREFQEKYRKETEIEENRETLKTLRTSIREVCAEMRELRANGSSLCSASPAVSRAARSGLQSLLDERRTLITRNAELAASL